MNNNYYDERRSAERISEHNIVIYLEHGLITTIIFTIDVVMVATCNYYNDIHRLAHNTNHKFLIYIALIQSLAPGPSLLTSAAMCQRCTEIVAKGQRKTEQWTARVRGS